ncbi:MAG: DUF896 domain-containing protein [Erysipelotrichaceae bacterium]|nr:DUF896 domain-containing protein [Erysipelotrichaceae bacterium]
MAEIKDILPEINALAKKSKTVGLTEEEKARQKELRQQYLAIYRAGLKQTLESLTIIDPEGNDVTPNKIKAKRVS